jgi:ABC-type enterobactin transport system permease subunit
VAFVAFMAAPIARRLTRGPLTIVPAALTGALLVVVADLADRRIELDAPRLSSHLMENRAAATGRA